MDHNLSEFVKKVKDALDIVNVVGEYVTLHKAGINHKGICPFHDDHTPSMVVSKSRQTFNCFVCGKKGEGHVMRCHYNPAAIVAELSQNAKEHHLMRNIHVCVRFIEQHHGCILRNGHRQICTLTLAA